MPITSGILRDQKTATRMSLHSEVVAVFPDELSVHLVEAFLLKEIAKVCRILEALAFARKRTSISTREVLDLFFFLPRAHLRFANFPKFFVHSCAAQSSDTQAGPFALNSKLTATVECMVIRTKYIVYDGKTLMGVLPNTNDVQPEQKLAPSLSMLSVLPSQSSVADTSGHTLIAIEPNIVFFVSVAIRCFLSHDEDTITRVRQFITTAAGPVHIGPLFNETISAFNTTLFSAELSDSSLQSLLDLSDLLLSSNHLKGPELTSIIPLLLSIIGWEHGTVSLTTRNRSIAILYKSLRIANFYDSTIYSKIGSIIAKGITSQKDCYKKDQLTGLLTLIHMSPSQSILTIFIRRLLGEVTKEQDIYRTPLPVYSFLLSDPSLKRLLRSIILRYVNNLRDTPNESRHKPIDGLHVSHADLCQLIASMDEDATYKQQ